MPNAQMQLRDFKEGEEQKLQQISRSRTAAQRAVERAQIVLLFSAGKRAKDIAQEVGRTQATVYYQVHQFNDRGLAFVEDLPREGRPLVYSEQQRGEIVKAAKTQPEPVTCITRLRLDAALYEPAPPYAGCGRPREKGDRLPTPQTFLETPDTQWAIAAIRWYDGQIRDMELASAMAVWFHYGKHPVPIRRGSMKRFVC